MSDIHSASSPFCAKTAETKNRAAKRKKGQIHQVGPPTSAAPTGCCQTGLCQMEKGPAAGCLQTQSRASWPSGKPDTRRRPISHALFRNIYISSPLQTHSSRYSKPKLFAHQEFQSWSQIKKSVIMVIQATGDRKGHIGASFEDVNEVFVGI